MQVSVRSSTLAMAAFGALALAATGALGATTINFDDIANGDGQAISAGYDGMTWRNFDVLDAVEYETTNGPNGYSNGVTSTPNVALNGFGEAASFKSTTKTPFTLNDLYLVSAWRDDLEVQITGVLDGVTEDSVTETLGVLNATHVVLNWTGIDEVDFSASGGTLHGYVDKGEATPGEQFGLDSVTLNGPIVSPGVPEPAAWALMILGFGGIGVCARRRERAGAPAA